MSVAVITGAASGMGRSCAELALELGPHVRVNALAPGWVDTPGNRATGETPTATGGSEFR